MAQWRGFQLKGLGSNLTYNFLFLSYVLRKQHINLNLALIGLRSYSVALRAKFEQNCIALCAVDCTYVNF